MQPLSTNTFTTPEPQPLRSLLLLTGLVILGMTLGSALALAILFVLSALGVPTAPTDIVSLLQHPANYPNGWYWLMLVQGVSHVCTFFLPAMVYWRWVDHRGWADFQLRPLSTVAFLGLVVLIVVAFMPFDGLIIEWNQKLHLPDTLAPIERWMRAKEDQLAELTKFLTSFRTTPQLLVALLVIAILPAIGEETLFRGVLQRKFIAWTGNVHIGIWVAAALFSAIHVQFYGFFPRMLLGALFGYLYLWSGNLWVPILAHFVNNGFTVVMVYLYQQKLISVDIESTDAVPISGALLSFALSTGLLWYFRKTNHV